MSARPPNDPTSAAVDPRTIITPDSFTVAPELIGVPLARPLRRAAAMLLDLVPLALLVNAGAVFFAIAGAALLWRASARPPTAGAKPRPKRRALLRVAATLVLFMAVLRIWNGVERRMDRSTRTGLGTGSGAVAVELSVGDIASFGDVLGLKNASDPETAERHARRLGEWLESKGESEDAQRALAGTLLTMVQEGSAAAAALRAELGPLLEPGNRAARDDSVLVAYAEAVTQRDTAAQSRLRPLAQSAVAGERLLELELERDRIRGEYEALEERYEGRRGGFITRFFGGIADDLGIGFGWTALYFTAFLALWNGQTPGKRVLGIQVIRLDGKPIGWWIAFERFGGYAASIWTGLLGFAQIIWDRNRQGLHDKIAETVVIRVRQGKPYHPHT